MEDELLKRQHKPQDQQQISRLARYTAEVLSSDCNLIRAAEELIVLPVKERF